LQREFTIFEEDQEGVELTTKGKGKGKGKPTKKVESRIDFKLTWNNGYIDNQDEEKTSSLTSSPFFPSSSSTPSKSKKSKKQPAIKEESEKIPQSDLNVSTMLLEVKSVTLTKHLEACVDSNREQVLTHICMYMYPKQYIYTIYICIYKNICIFTCIYEYVYTHIHMRESFFNCYCEYHFRRRRGTHISIFFVLFTLNWSILSFLF
jgi:hypothetical protein